MSGMRQGKGKVYLVGAGPGDPELLTLKGARCLKQADVVLYDHLAHPQLLSLAPAHAELIDRGKRMGHPDAEQNDMNQLLIARASQGKCVVRLKGGDPFVFGRGGEEALALQRAGIAYEVVPGITAAVAVSAYAGIPLTHRRLATAVTIVTGHESPAKEASQINWDMLAASKGTLVFYMSAKTLPDICSRLIAAGMPSDTPAAFVQWGTTASQQSVVADLRALPERVRQQGLGAPSITIVGTVVGLQEQIAWFASRPLSGKRIVVTRERKRAEALALPLRALGAEVMEAPCIDIVPVVDYGVLDHAIRVIQQFDWIVFTSANAVAFFLERLLEAGRDCRNLATVRIAAVGPGTRRALRAAGLHADRMPETFVAESVVEMFSRQDSIGGKKFLLPCSKLARPAIPDAFRRAGADVLVAPAYTAVVPCALRRILKASMQRGVDLVAFTSASGVENFMHACEALDIKPGFGVACIGPVTAGKARALGLNVDVEADEYTIPGLVDAIVRHYT